MKKYIVILFIAIAGFVAGCNQAEYDLNCSGDNRAECDFWGISPIATPTPNIDEIQGQLDNWLKDYLNKSSLW